MQELIGKKVVVHTIAGAIERQDVGVIESFDGNWVKLKKGDSEVIYFSVGGIRCIKLFDA